MGELGNMFKPRLSACSDLDIVLLMLGTNDAANYDINFKTGNVDYVEKVFSDRLTRLIAGIQAKAPGAELMIVTPPPIGSDRQSGIDRRTAIAISTAIRKVLFGTTGNLGITCIDCFSPLAVLGESESLEEDGLHITDAAGRSIASTILPHVISSFARSSKGQELGFTAPAQPVETDADALLSDLGVVYEASCLSFDEDEMEEVELGHGATTCDFGFPQVLQIFEKEQEMLSSVLSNFLKRANSVF
jgi:hypothetical protein